MAVVFSTLAKTVNHLAAGYALQLTCVARDGGLREDSMKIFCIFCHPRTAQKYDRNILAVGWDSKLQEALLQERKHFEELKLAQSVLESLSGDKSSQSFEAATLDVKWLEDTVPPQLQLCWDNLNLRSKHKFERQKDNYYENNFDWMASIWLQERVSANHMEHSSGKPLKQPMDLTHY